MPKYEFARVRLEAAEKDKGTSLLTMYPASPGKTKTMPGGATKSNMYRHLARMGEEGWQMVSAQTVPNGDSKWDVVFWLQREIGD